MKVVPDHQRGGCTERGSKGRPEVRLRALLPLPNAKLETLSLQVARGELLKPKLENEQAELVFRKGREHEAAYLARLRAEGKSVTEISLEPDFDWERAARETEEAIRAGVDVVYQGVLMDDRWRGQADGTYENRPAKREILQTMHDWFVDQVPRS